MDLGLEGLKAAVSGGSRGIGRAIAGLLAEEGCDVSICARGQEKIDEAVKEFQGHGVRAMGRALQGRDGEAVRGWMRDTVEELGGLDLFVANLSAGGGTDDERYWYRNFEIDLMSATRSVEEAYPSLKKSENASILIIATMAASETFVAPMAYNSMKAALITWSKQLAEFYAPKGIRVNCLSPGPTMFPGSNWEMIKVARSRTFTNALRQQPTRRMGEAEEIARAAVFLASPAARWCVGSHLLVDGGFTKGVQF
ncbi:SDR family NAD(P)-dependent oxidoreductase [Maritimibacter sp. DP1N21-5]|uniref:SDR family NAD(P)-dependent oxidoreductase n=1 Tax=Maritimibacter sp. DP1N21-5 TaxID=2836867 RepID=UPI001C48409B|nr:SDR family oxidoreductase [Maritimibacter sp. DP1N21-5]MBV7407356.1 SDR family oxidoreductase [Maritimibacter sp. DP1N21-5]